MQLNNEQIVFKMSQNFRSGNTSKWYVLSNQTLKWYVWLNFWAESETKLIGLIEIETEIYFFLVITNQSTKRKSVLFIL